MKAKITLKNRNGELEVNTESTDNDTTHYLVEFLLKKRMAPGDELVVKFEG